MPGLVKVGKTTRLPSDRADELSGVTGVATPFIVVYEEYFDDCDAVEAHVHTRLAGKGLRLSANREFFRAAVSDVVKTIISAQSESSAGAAVTPHELSGLVSADTTDFCDLQLEAYEVRQPWDDLLDEADGHYYAYEGYLEDYPEAFKLYRDAARLGSPIAYERLGTMYRQGEGVRENYQSALDCFKEGAKRANYFCWAGMASVFIETHHRENTEKSLLKFISEGELDGWAKSTSDRHINTIMLILLAIERSDMMDHKLLFIILKTAVIR